MKFLKKHSLISIFILIFSFFFYAQETQGEFYISLFSGNNSKYKLTEYKGPFENVNQAIADWIYEDLPQNGNYAISKKNAVLMTRTPESYYRKEFETVMNEFSENRFQTMNKYHVVPVEKIETAFQKKSKYFIKKLHPREYFFDVSDITKEIYLKNEDDNLFSATVDFTSLCSNDLPHQGDKVTVFYYFKTTNQLNNLEIELYGQDPNKESFILGEKNLAEKLDKNQTFRGNTTFSLDKSCLTKIYIKFINHAAQSSGKAAQAFLKFKKIADSTNTIKEAENEKKAISANLEIIEEANSIIEEELKIQEEEKLRIEKEQREKIEEERRLEEERKRKEEEALEAERLRLEREKLEQEEFSRKLEEATKSTAERYQKEYLQDYETEPFALSIPDTKNKNAFAGDPNEIDATSKSLLMKAAKSGNDWQIKTLINAGADINYKDKDGWTALMYAVRYQENLNAVTLLLKAGADVKVENNFRTTALTIATCYNNNPDILNELLKYFEPSNEDVLKSLTMLFVSSQPSEFIQIAKLNVFLNKGVPINTFYEGKTPLMYACQYCNYTSVIQLLLDNKAAVTIRSSEGKTAFDYACVNTNLQHDDTYWSLNRKKIQ